MPGMRRLLEADMREITEALETLLKDPYDASIEIAETDGGEVVDTIATISGAPFASTCDYCRTKVLLFRIEVGGRLYFACNRHLTEPLAEEVDEIEIEELSA